MRNKIDTFKDDRMYAGRRFADAAAELRRCWIELSALDLAIAETRRSPLSTFADYLDPAVLIHPDFLPVFGGNWQAEAAARLDQLIGRTSLTQNPSIPAVSLSARAPQGHRHLRGFWGR
jgi:hypothetical protein